MRQWTVLDAKTAQRFGFTPTSARTRVLRMFSLYFVGILGGKGMDFGHTVWWGDWIICAFGGIAIWTVGQEWAQGYPDFIRTDTLISKLNEDSNQY